MKLTTRLQLSGMMFLNYFIWGCWFVTIITYMTNTLGFGDEQAGLAFSTYAIAAMISPFFIGLVADRFFATERILGVLHLIGAVLLYALSTATTFTPFFILLMAYTLCYMPTIALTNSLSFQHVENQEKDFPGIRVLGTIGWIAAGLFIGFLAMEKSVVPIQIAAASSVLMGLYCFTLPHTPPKAKGQKAGIREILGLDALSLMKDRSFATVIISSFLICIPLAFYYAWTNPFLVELNVEASAALQSMGQVSEILFLLLMPLLFVRWGIKNVMLIGMAAWALRYVLFAFGDNQAMVWALYTGIILHGVCYDFFFVAGQIYVDKAAPDKLRGAAQGLITFATYGVGLFVGTWLSSQVVNSYQTDPGHNWRVIWLIPAVMAAVILVVFALQFKNPKSEAVEPKPNPSAV